MSLPEVVYSEDRLLTLSKEDSLLWDLRTAHLLPPIRSPNTIHWAREVSAAPRHAQYTHTSGYTVYFNIIQRDHTFPTRKLRPYLGSTPSSTRDNEIWQAFYPINADWTGSHFRRVLLSNLSLRAAIHGPTHDGSFQLEPSISEAWSRLENAVVRILDCLLPHLSLPYSITLPPYPSSNSYSKFFPSEDTAYEAYLPIFIDTNLPIIVHLGLPGMHIEELQDNPLIWERYSPFLKHATQYAIQGYCCDQCDRRRQQLHHSVIAQTDPKVFVQNREVHWLEHCAALGLPPDKDLGSYDEHDSEAHRKLSKFAIYEWTGEHGHCRRNPIDPRHFLTMLRAYPLNSRYVSLLHSEIDFFKASQQLSLITPTILQPTLSLLTPPNPTAASAVTHSFHHSPNELCKSNQGCLPPTAAEPSSSSPPVSTTPNPSSWNTVLKLRLGYHHDASRHLSPPVPNPLHAKFPDDVRGIHRSLRVLGLHPEVHSLQMSREAVMSCLYAVQALHDHKSGIYDLPVQFDLSAGDLWHRLRRTFNVEEVVSTYDKVDVHSKDKKLLTVTEYKYALGSYDRPMDQQCFVLILDAFALVEVARSPLTGVLQVGTYLTQHGIAYSTAGYYPPTVNPTHCALPREGQGVILHGEAFSEARYNAYEHKRDEVLTGIAGGLALKEGGFVARMARDVVNFNNALQRPSPDASKRGRVLGRVKSGQVIIADQLTPNVLDAILGRYLRFKNSDAQESVTLWPARPNWELMWINTNAWNQEAEAWFNDQVRAWRTPVDQRKDQGRLHLKTSREWRSASRGLTQVREVWNNYQRLAESYVRRRFST
ncbi:hypothetical protein FA13DRAFT_1801992 [Coprinellus micaceus]|uniref:Uncharacterized protein n=1 Tax=Coprinellus micaceus TaxID=71717 RepID=A0A4Y7SD95_COPMI|nr:hypothetical protein FA13DRAFT_1801992 [Coprinellus micaceus]